MCALSCVLTALGSTALAVDIEGVQPIGFDQPQVELILQPEAGGDPYLFDLGFGIKLFNITAFLDTGSSGIVISPFTADPLGVPRNAGRESSKMSRSAAARSSPSRNRSTCAWRPMATRTWAIWPRFQTVYNQAYNSVRLQIGPTNLSPDPASLPVDIVGMPVMMGKTVVMDPKPLNIPVGLPEPMKTYIYDPGTPFNPATADSNPGIPTTSHHVAAQLRQFRSLHADHARRRRAGHAESQSVHRAQSGAGPRRRIRRKTIRR